MEHKRDREKWLRDIQSAYDHDRVLAAKSLLALCEYGSPAGVYALTGGKAALRLGRLADAVVLLYQGLQLAESHSLVWAELLVNRASACARHGFYLDAIHAAEMFLGSLPQLPAAGQWAAWAHHAAGFAHDRLRQYDQAVQHHRMALDLYADVSAKADAACDLAYSLALSGSPEEALRLLDSVPESLIQGLSQFGYVGTRSIVLHALGRHANALEAGDEAEQIASGCQDIPAVALAHVHYWMSRSALATGDRYRSYLLGLRAAVVADQHWDIMLRDMATEWLSQVMEGGIVGA